MQYFPPRSKIEKIARRYYVQEVALIATRVRETFQSCVSLCDVPLAAVLYQPRDVKRLINCVDLLVQEYTAPPIAVSEYELDGQRYYVVSDGMHRSAAAALLGRRTIRAEVGGSIKCRPQDMVLIQDVVYRVENGQLARNGRIPDDAVADARAELLFLGVQEIRRSAQQTMITNCTSLSDRDEDSSRLCP